MTAPAAIAADAPGHLARGAGWSTSLTVLAAASLALLALFAGDVADMATIWWTNATFGHCLMVLPVIGWLVWQRWPDLGQLTPRPWRAALGIIALGGLFWLLGSAASVAVARHFGLVIMLQGLVAAVLGKAVTRGLLFPLCYALFLVPAGDQLVPPMQVLTAHFCMALLGLQGIPAHLDGVFIAIPNGMFEVAEACSGVKFLIAMVAYGALVSNVFIVSWRRRLIFMTAAIVVPIIANGIRAWGTIYVSHLTSQDFAASFDHIVYGWVFFAVVIVVLMIAGRPLFDRPIDAPWFDAAGLQAPGTVPAPARAGIAMAAAALAVAAVAPGWMMATARLGAATVPAAITLTPPPGWHEVAPRMREPWAPRFVGADAVAMRSFADAQGRQIDMAVALFGRQHEGAEIVGFGQGAIDPASDWAWAADPAAPSGWQGQQINAPGPIVRDVAIIYRIGGRMTADARVAKLETLKARLLGGDQAAVAVLVSAERPQAEAETMPLIGAFIDGLGPMDAFTDRALGR